MNWGYFLALCLLFFAAIFYLMDMQQRISKIEVKVEYLKKEFKLVNS